MILRLIEKKAPSRLRENNRERHCNLLTGGELFDALDCGSIPQLEIHGILKVNAREFHENCWIIEVRDRAGGLIQTQARKR